MENDSAIAALGALAQGTRLDVFRLLVRHEPDGMAAGDIARQLDVPQNTMSAHLGILARAVLGSPAVTALTLVDIDRRAVEMARRNVVDPRASLRWEDLRVAEFETGRLDFVVMNPPFHDGGTEDQALGQTFVRRAAEMLRPGGALWVTANAHLPYEAVLRGAFREVTQRAGAGGYKVYEARR